MLTEYKQLGIYPYNQVYKGAKWKFINYILNKQAIFLVVLKSMSIRFLK